MKDTIKILVFPAGTEIGLEVHNSLKFVKNIELFGVNTSADHAKYVYKNYIENIPYVDDPHFVKEIIRLVKKLKIDLIFPTHDSVVLKLSQNKNLLGCRLITSNLKTCTICRSKLKTYKLFSDKIKVPQIYNINSKNIKFPIFLKPDVGQGTRGTYIANTKSEIKFYIKKDPSLLILEYLPGREYTIDCFTDRHGILQFVGPRIRARISNGISVNSYPVINPAFQKVATIINKTIKLRGVWFFQMKEAVNGKLTLMEIAPRVGGTMGLSRNRGINLPLLSLFDALNVDVSVYQNPHSVEVDRALISRYKTNLVYKHVYIDYDDTIIINGKVNPSITAFLYQCINSGIKLHLLSRHNKTKQEKVKINLIEHRLLQLFDEIIDVPDEIEKSIYITQKSAIFIDDSFSERIKVHNTLKIPVFNTDEVESLINWNY